MSPLDAIVLILLAVFIIRGIWVGFIRQVASLLALVAGFLVAGHYYGESNQIITPFIRNEQVGFLVSYAVIFCLVFILTIFIGLAVRKVAQLILLDWFDKSLGGILGAAKGFFLACIAFMILATFISGSSSIFTRSLLYPYLQKSSFLLLSAVKNDHIRDRMLPRQPAISNLLSHTIETGQELGRQAKQKAGDY
ncbi:MAG: CvpA family protein [Desulfurivibrionaceae bacterium]|nr:CvpA family protein [Desulfurivibrionaceae bacterium]